MTQRQQIIATTCQICGRAIKASTGQIAHHGYKQPWANTGDHARTTSCPGSRYQPYEVSRSAIPRVRDNYETQRLSQDESLAAFITKPPVQLTTIRSDAWGVATTKLYCPDGFDPASPRRSYLRLAYDTEYHARLRAMRSNLAALIEAIAFLDERYVAWKEAA